MIAQTWSLYVKEDEQVDDMELVGSGVVGCGVGESVGWKDGKGVGWGDGRGVGCGVGKIVG